jgi:hypothetical protein
MIRFGVRGEGDVEKRASKRAGDSADEKKKFADWKL